MSKGDQVRITETHKSPTLILVQITECVSGGIVWERLVSPPELSLTRRSAWGFAKGKRYEVVQ